MNTSAKAKIVKQCSSAVANCTPLSFKDTSRNITSKVCRKS